MKFFLILFVIAIGVLGFLLLQQDQDGDGRRGDDLFPGEVRAPGYSVPIITDIMDDSCSTDTTCPSRGLDCVKKNFTVQKDTTYRVFAAYYNGDSTVPSCRVCASIYENRPSGDSVVIEEVVSACATGGPWGGSARLVPGRSYTLSLCLQRCPLFERCDCGEVQVSLAVISIRDVLPDLERLFRSSL